MESLTNDDYLDDYNTLEFDAEDTQDEDIGYPDMQIKIDREQYSIFELKRKYDKHKIIMDPSFQRNDVWGIKQKSELIESVVMGIPLPLIYLAENKMGQLVVVDGRQRLTAFFDFLSNKFKLNHLKILTQLNGKNFVSLEEKYPEYAFGIEDYQLIIQVIKHPTPDRVRFDLFDRVNRGGTSLNKQEMRNALYQGNSTILLQRIAENESFKNATGYSVSNKRMKDTYIILRAIAFMLFFDDKLVDGKGNKVIYKSDMEDLLGKTMEYLNSLNKDDIEEIEKEFCQIMSRVYHDFEDNAFRMLSKDNKKKQISMTLFETIVYLYHKIGEQYQEKRAVKPITRLKEDETFLVLLKSSVDSFNGIKSRFQRVSNLYGEIVND